MISFHSGIQALRKFKVKAVNEKISSKFSDLNLLSTEYIHFIETDKELNSKNKKNLDKLLHYAPHLKPLKSSEYFIVIQSLGSISGWSS